MTVPTRTPLPHPSVLVLPLVAPPPRPSCADVVGREELVHELRHAIGTATGAPVGLVRIDVARSPDAASDRDVTTIALARHARRIVRGGDVVAHLAERVLAVMLRDVTQAQARHVAARLRTELERPEATSAGRTRITVSHVHHRLSPGADAIELLRMAELHARARRSRGLSARIDLRDRGDGPPRSDCA